LPPRVVLFVPAGTAVLGVLLASAFRGEPDSAADWLAPIGPSVAFAAAALWLFDRFLWRLPVVRRLAGRPVLDGTWAGTIATDWVNEETGRRKPPDGETFLVISQRFWSITVRLLTRESRSSSIRADLTQHPDGACDLVYVYRNNPHSEVRHRSEIHYGAARLTVPRVPGGEIDGDYFTDRGTRGRMTFGARLRGHPDTYAAALRHRSGATA
jgi:hypothetical protein